MQLALCWQMLAARLHQNASAVLCEWISAEAAFLIQDVSAGHDTWSDQPCLIDCDQRWGWNTGVTRLNHAAHQGAA